MATASDFFAQFPQANGQTFSGLGTLRVGPNGVLTPVNDSPIRTVQGTAAPGGQPMGSGGATDPWTQQLRQALVRANPNAPQSYIDSQVDYFTQKRADPTELSSWATGEPGRTMDDYWLMRASSPASDAPGQPMNGAVNPDATGQLPSGYWTGYENGGGPYPLANAGGPGLNAPFTAAFQAPNPQSIASDPSYQFQLQQGLDAVQKSAAAKGTLLSGGTLKDLNNYAQGLASTFDDKYWNRALGIYDRAQDTFFRNNNLLTGNLGALTSSGYNAATQYGANQTNQANANAGATVAKGNATGAAIGAGVNAVNQYINSDDAPDWLKNLRPGAKSTNANPYSGAATSPADYRYGY